MSLVVPWLVFPIVLGLLSFGCGLLVEQAAGVRVARVLVLPVGFALIVVAGLVTTSNGGTAQLTTPLVITLAVLGLALSLPFHLRRPDGWAVTAALGAYAAFGAPVLMSGAATFAGYITLDDTSSWLGITDRLLEHGRSVAGLAPSTYQAMLNYYLNQYGYPVGTFPPLGIGHSLVGTDSAWLIQPYHAFLAAMLALCLYGLLARLVESREARALAAFVAAQPALLYGYSLWGGVKEMATSAMVVLVAALTPWALRERASARSLVPLATASAALFGILNLGSAVWLGPLLVPVLVAGIGLRRRAFVPLAAGFTAVAVALSIPSLLLAGSFARDLSLNGTGGDIGNLYRPLSWLQVFGIWPVGDFRLRPSDMRPTYVLIGLVIGAAAGGIAWAVRQRAWELPLYVGAALVGSYVATRGGSAWIDAKALAIASPALLVAGMAGAAWLFRTGRFVEGALVAGALTGGVLWSNALAYHDVWLAPRSQLHELQVIGTRFAGQGPTLITEDQSYGARHFLRSMDPESPGELRSRPIPLRNGQLVAKGQYADIDEFQLSAILIYRTLVTLHTPAASRPPSVYRLAWSGRYYDVWQRPDQLATHILAHLPLGSGIQPAAVPRCSDVLRIANRAGKERGRLATVQRPRATVLQLSQASYPSSWQAYSGSPNVVYPSPSGTLRATVAIPASGRYGIWLGGSFRRGLKVSIDGRLLANARDRLNHLGVYTPLGDMELAAGTHHVLLRYSAAQLRPGSGGAPFPLGPLIFSRYTDELPVTYVQPTNARSLCGKSLDWVETVRS